MINPYMHACEAENLRDDDIANKEQAIEYFDW